MFLAASPFPTKPSVLVRTFHSRTNPLSLVRTFHSFPWQYIIFKITDDKKFIEVEHKGAKDETFTSFCSKLNDGECRYAVLDVEINTKSGATANKLIFVAWCVSWHALLLGIGGGINSVPSHPHQRSFACRNQPCAHVPCLLFHACRSDDNASIKPKMLYASSKDALKKTLTGINEEFQATDRGDLDETEIKKKAGHC